MATATINRVYLNRQCEAWFWGENVAAPIVNGPVAKVAAYVARYGEPTIVVEYRTVRDAKEMTRDRKTYTKRLARLTAECGYVAGDFAPDRPDSIVFRATMTRK